MDWKLGLVAYVVGCFFCFPEIKSLWFRIVTVLGVLATGILSWIFQLERAESIFFGLSMGIIASLNYDVWRDIDSAQGGP